MAADALVPLEHHWLGLCLVTESNRRKEWPLIAAVIQNRVRSKRYPDTFTEVILHRMQFSAFNDYGGDRSAPERQEVIWTHLGKKQPLLLLTYAIDQAARMMEHDADGHRISDLISPVTYHYWSPVSMQPKGKQPAWASSASRIYTPEGFDPERFSFAENVP